MVPIRCGISMPCSSCTAAAISWIRPRTMSSSRTEATSGIMISGLGASPPALSRAAAASRIARACMVNRWGIAMPSRTPRRPSIGFCSCRRWTAASSLRCRFLRWPRASAIASATESSVRSGRNSCSGGSISRMVTGSPSMASKIRVKSSRWSGSSSASAASCSCVVVGDDEVLDQLRAGRRGTCARCGTARCPGRRSGGRGRRPRRCRRWCGPSSGGRRRRAPSAGSRPRRGARRPPRPRSGAPPTSRSTGTAPRNTSPVVPSIEITSPSRTVGPPRTANSPSRASTSSASAPHTQVRPMPRATTAACEVLPPRLVSTPRATIIPCRSSGVVSLRTRITSSPRSAHSTAVAQSKTALPTAAPG